TDNADWKTIRKFSGTTETLASASLLYAKQKPNRKTLGIFKINLWVYNMFYKPEKNLKGLRSFMITKIGEPPVIFDSVLMILSSRRIEEYLHSKGFLKAKVSSYYTTTGKKATVHFKVTAGTLCTIDSFQFVRSKGSIGPYFSAAQNNTLLKKGAPLDLEMLNLERKRIQKELQKNGFYKFNSNEIIFDDVDTLNRTKVFVSVRLIENDTSESQRRFFLRNVFVNEDYDPLVLKTGNLNTNQKFMELKFISDTNVISKKRMYPIIFILPSENYNREKSDFTLRRISGLGVFRFVNLQYKQTGFDSLDCTLNLTPYPYFNLNTEIKGANIEGNIGNSVSLTVLNRNLARDATRLSFNATGGVEIPTVSFDSLLFNASGGITFSFPRIIFPVFKLNKKVSKYAEQKTNVSFTSSALLQSNVYTLYNQNFSLSYLFTEPVKELKKHEPGISLTYTRPIILSDSFSKKLESDFLLKQTFSDLLITSVNYYFTFSNQDITRRKNYFLLRTGAEFSGWIFKYLGDFGIIHFKQNEFGQPLLFSVPRTQFIRPEFDIRQYYMIGRQGTIALRGFFGAGFTFSDKYVLPYIRQFYAGGPNDIRAWKIRSLGPGSAPATSTVAGFYNQTGDLKLEGNAEYRFPVIGILKGALFVDAGNVWLLKNDTSKSGEDFSFNRFYKEIAIGAGAGARLDFSFFVFRLDVATPVHAPLSGTTGWVFGEGGLTKNLTFNLAIGYPF
ncbi:MAG TPA: hypothetical protein DCQ93_05680, partial [Bacteroidetes bacterium]|nr:hypothetical protein [Bacteroidota bacterium]